MGKPARNDEREPPKLRALRPASLIVFVSSLLLNLSYFPANQGWLAWIAWSPWLLLVRADLRHRDRYLIAWIAAWAFYFPALRWMRVAHDAMVFSWIGLSLMCSWYAPIALSLIRRLDRRGWPLTLSAPVVFTALEWFRSWFLGGFPWYLLGHTQHGNLAIVQIADLGGVPLVTFLVAAVNGFVTEWLCMLTTIRDRLHIASPIGRWRYQLAGIVAAITLTVSYGYWRLTQRGFEAGPRVALLQTDIAQSDRNNKADDGRGDTTNSVENIESQTKSLMKQAVALSPRPDLIIWPETTFPWDMKLPAAPTDEDVEYKLWSEDLRGRVELIRQAVAGCGSAVLLGMNVQQYVRAGKSRRYNSSVLVNSDGEYLDRYDKVHLVPFGEYVPLGETFPILNKLAPYDDALNLLAPGERFTRLKLTVRDREFTFGCLTCYEDSYATLSRKYMSGPGRPVDFLVNQSNDGWFMCTHEHEEHLAVSRFRAIESRRPMVRAVNMGISAIIDGNGRIVALPAKTWSASKGKQAVVSAPLPLDSRFSLYVVTGDILPWVCWGAIAASFVIRRPKGSA